MQKYRAQLITLALFIAVCLRFSRSQRIDSHRSADLGGITVLSVKENPSSNAFAGLPRQPVVRRRQRRQQPFSNELIFQTTTSTRPPQFDNNTPSSSDGQVVYVNNRPTVATLAPFVAASAPTTRFISCFNSCQTTSEYNPICGSDMQLYYNEQKFNCARNCGADVQIVRRGNCDGLPPVMRG